jgi:hypothetical protein
VLALLPLLAFVALFLVSWLRLCRPEETFSVWRDAFARLRQPIGLRSKGLSREPSDDRY